MLKFIHGSLHLDLYLFLLLVRSVRSDMTSLTHFAGWLLDRFGFAVGIFLLILCVATYNILIMIHILQLQILTFIVYSFTCVLYGAILFGYLPRM